MWKLAVLSFLLPAAMARAATAEGGCDEGDPRVAHVVTVSGGATIALARRANQIAAAPLEPLCRGDLILPGRSSAVIEIERRERAQVQVREQRYYFFDGTMFVLGQPRLPPGRPGGILASSAFDEPSPVILFVNDPARTGKAAELHDVLASELTRTGRFRVAAPGDASERTGVAGLVSSPDDPTRSFMVEATLADVGTTKTGVADGDVSGGPTTRADGCAQTPGSVLILMRAASDTGVPYGKQADGAAGPGSTCAGPVVQPVDDAAFRQAIARAAAELTSEIYPATLTAVNPDGSFALSGQGGALRSGEILSVELSVPSADDALRPIRWRRDRNLRTLGLVKVTTTDPKGSTAIPLTTFLVPPPIGSTLTPTGGTAAPTGSADHSQK